MVERLARIPGTVRLPSESQARAALSGFAAALSGEAASLRALVSALLDRRERIVEAEESRETGGSRDPRRVHVDGDEAVSGVKTFADGIVLSGENDPIYFAASIFSSGDIVLSESTRFDGDPPPAFGSDCRAVPKKDLEFLLSFVSEHKSWFRDDTLPYLDSVMNDLWNVYSNVRQAIDDYERSTGRNLASDWSDIRAVLSGGPVGAGSTMSDDRIDEIRKKIVAAAESWIVSNDGGDSPGGRLYRMLLRLERIEKAVGPDFPDFELPFQSLSSTSALQTVLGGVAQ